MKFYCSIILLLLSFSLKAQKIPVYYKNLSFKSASLLKFELQKLTAQKHTRFLAYTSNSSVDVWDALNSADENPENPEEVLLLYGYNDADNQHKNDRKRAKNLACHQSGCSGFWNREHVYPKSLGTPNLGTDNAGADAHALRATDGDQNSSRNNREFANGKGNAHITPKGYWFPGAEWKGDVARMMMYMFIRYPKQCKAIRVAKSSFTYDLLKEMPDIFLEWNVEDPVSPFEIKRNNLLEKFQGNRNPFIDNPYLATYIWNGPNAQNTWGTIAKKNQKPIKVEKQNKLNYFYLQETPKQDYNIHILNLKGELLLGYKNISKIPIENLPASIYIFKIFGTGYCSFKTIVVE